MLLAVEVHLGLLETAVLLTIAGLVGVALAVGLRVPPALALLPVAWSPLRALMQPAQGGATLREALATLQQALDALALAGPTTCHAAMAVGVGAAASCLGQRRSRARWQLAMGAPILLAASLPAVEVYTRDVDSMLVLRALDYVVIGIVAWIMLTTEHRRYQIMGGVLLLLSLASREFGVLAATLAESAGIVASSGFSDPTPLWIASRQVVGDLATRSAILIAAAAMPAVAALARTAAKPRAAIAALWLLLLIPMGLRLAANPAPNAPAAGPAAPP